jgi:GNAT superfamily N-acetyltransferase
MNSPSPNSKAISISNATYDLRLATLADVETIARLIDESARRLSTADYSAAQIDGALQGTFGVDTQLIRDGSYWVIETDGRIVAAGGWSRRAAMCGGDNLAGKVADALDPARDAARIRAFFVHPDVARQGLGRRLLEQCEHEAARHGFHRVTLLATLPGVRLYRACGYVGDELVSQTVGDGVQMPFVPMHKSLRMLSSA